MNKELFKEVTEWQKETFPEATDLSKLHHLKQELEELMQAIHYLNQGTTDTEVESEFADCFLLLFGAAKAHGMTFEEITKCIQDKFEVNKKRTWGNPDENGVVNHVKEETEFPEKCLSSKDYALGNFEKCSFWSNNERGCEGCKHDKGEGF